MPYPFDKFIVAASNELAYTTARKIAEEEKLQRPLYLYGGSGRDNYAA